MKVILSSHMVIDITISEICKGYVYYWILVGWENFEVISAILQLGRRK